MNPAHIHLITSHAPVMGTIFGLCLLFYAHWRKSEDFKHLALLVFVAGALLTLPVYLSGQPASDLLLRLVPGMTMDAGDQHAEIGILALTGSLVLGIVSLVGLILFRKGRKLPAGFLICVLVLAVLSCGFLIWTANLGGKIRHPEIRPQLSAYGRSGQVPGCLVRGVDWHVGCSFPALELRFCVFI
jgi:hypothetical protein